MSLTKVPGTMISPAQSGSVIQTIQTQLTNIQSISASAYSWNNVPGASVTITPQFSTSKILVQYSCMAQTTTPAPYYATYVRITRNGTAVGVGTTGTGILCGSFGVGFQNTYATSQNQIFLDNPSTTSAVTYQLQVAGENTAIVVGGTYNSYTTGGGNPNIPTTIIVMEIAG